MTNAEKYQEVFGFPPDKGNCPTECCAFCPVKPCNANGPAATFDWWDEEYKGGAGLRKPNCVTCDHFGDCEGCERSGEE